MANKMLQSLKFPGLSDDYLIPLMQDFAPVYDSTATYAVGDYCTHDNKFYVCTTAISTAEAWTVGHWNPVSVTEIATAIGADVDDLKEALSELFESVAFSFEQGTLNSTNGATSTSNYRVRTESFIYCDSVVNIISNDTFLINVFWYKRNEHATGTFIESTGFISDKTYNIAENKPAGAAFFKIAVRYASGTSVSITPSNVTAQDVYGKTLIEDLQKPVPFSDDINAVCNIVKSWDVSSANSGSCFATKDGVTEQWTFNAGADDNQSDAAMYRRGFNPTTLEFDESSTGGRHTLGHVNSCSYNEFKDTFVCGNGSGDYELDGKLYLIEDAFEKTNFYITDALVIDFKDYGTKPNAVWGDDNNGAHNVIFVITNDGYDIYRILLGEDDTELESGTLQKSTGFNGTFKILNHWEYGSLKADYDNVVQGAFYFNNKVYWGFGHGTGIVPIHWVELLSNGKVKVGGINYFSYGDDGTQLVRSICSVANIANKAFTIFYNKIYMIELT